VKVAGALALWILISLAPVHAATPASRCDNDHTVLQTMLCSDDELAKADVDQARAYYDLVSGLAGTDLKALSDDQAKWKQLRLTHPVQGHSF